MPFGIAITQLTQVLVGDDFWAKSWAMSVCSLYSRGAVSSKNKFSVSSVDGRLVGVQLASTLDSRRQRIKVLWPIPFWVANFCELRGLMVKLSSNFCFSWVVRTFRFLGGFMTLLPKSDYCLFTLTGHENFNRCTCLDAYAVKGNRCFGTHNWGAKGRTNVIGALLFGAVLTVSLFQTNVNTGIFSSWVIEDLIPKLPANSVVIMDNASFHKGMLMKKAIEDAGHTLLYLPPYSPDLNPIEKKWAQAKAIRRRVGGSIDNLFKNHVL